jgi:hypothetical protein
MTWSNPPTFIFRPSLPIARGVNGRNNPRLTLIYGGSTGRLGRKIKDEQKKDSPNLSVLLLFGGSGNLVNFVVSPVA